MLHSPFDTFIQCTKIEEYLKSSNRSLKGTVLTVYVFDSELAKVLKDDKKLTGIIATEKGTYYNLSLDYKQKNIQLIKDLVNPSCQLIYTSKSYI